MNNGSGRNNRLITTVVDSSNGADTGLMYRAANAAWGFYNRSASAWQMPTGDWVTDDDYFSSKQLKCYIDSSKYWNFYIGDTLLFKSSAAVNYYVQSGATYGNLYLGCGLLSSVTTSTTSNIVMTVSRLRIYEGLV